MSKSQKNLFPHRRPVAIAALVGSLILAAYFAVDYVSYFYALGESALYWNTLTLDLIAFLAAGAAAVLGIFLTRQFGAGEKPRRVWFWFTIGWWAWFAGEAASSSYDVLKIHEYPDIASYDVFWTIGYLCFGLSLYYQFRLIYSGRKRSRTPVYFLMVAAALLITAGLTQWAIHAGLGEGKTFFAVALAVFYPVCDVIEGAGAIWLSLLFGRGKWGRPWWGLIAFAIADSVNIYDWLGGLAAVSADAYSVIYLAADTLYLAGYLIAAVAIFANYLLFTRPSTGGVLPAEEYALSSD